MRKLILSSVVIVGLSALLVNNFCCSTEGSSYTPRGEFQPQYSFRGHAEYYESLRTDVKTGKYNPLNKQIALQEVAKFSALKNSNTVQLDWIEMGPDNVGGRTRAIVVDKDDPRTIYAGAVAGGLWKSTNRGGTWSKIESFDQNIIISTMSQLPNGKFIIGTGCTFESPSGSGGSGFAGYGIYISEDNLQTFNHAVDQDGNFLRPSSEFSSSGTFVFTNEIVNARNNADEVWISYDRGLAKYNTVTKQFDKITESGMTSTGQDVDVSGDGQTVVSIHYTGSGFSQYSTPFISKDGGQTWVNLRTEGKLAMAPTGNSGRMEVAISKDDKNYIYFSMAQRFGSLFGVFGTEDAGETWASLMPGTVTSFDYMSSSASSQGNYDQAIEVVPGKPGVIILGGITLWKSGFDAAAEQIAQNFAPIGSPAYVHSDIHEFVFGQDGTLWIGCDGGIHRSDDTGLTFSVNNRGYNVTTFYDIDFANDGKVIGGAQDNGTNMIEFKGITEQTSRSVTGGDGFDCAFSKTNSAISFSTIQNSILLRSLDDNAYESFYDPLAGNAANNFGTFYSTFQFYENDNDPTSQSFVQFENTTGADIPAKTLLTLDSKTYGRTFQYTTGDSVIKPNGKVSVQDPFSSIFAMGMSGINGIWITRGAMQFGRIPQWFRVLETNGSIGEIEFGSDGTLYATNGSTLYRMTGLQNAWRKADSDLSGDSTVKVFQTSVIWPNSSNTITSISADPNNPNRILVTRGNYNGSDHIYICENALSANPTFTSIQGDLPDFPVYSGRIDAFDPNIILIGTEVGVFASDDAGQTWVEKNGGPMDRVPVYEIDQQTRTFGGDVTNTGFYYIGTHGRGAFRAENFFTSVTEKKNTAAKFEINVFPNPTTNVLKVNTGLAGEQLVEIFNNNGKLVKKERVASNGTVLSVNVNELTNGNYIVRATTVNGAQTAHFVKR